MSVFKSIFPDHREFLASLEMTAETGSPSPIHLAHSTDRVPLCIKKTPRYAGSECSNLS